mmetsp:Transcript_69875/g.140648  ORF Transcript_69875/g.140648 Transcript_69875/m.140648 type:complete len:90 (+) Transcript_69875:775-1044(+)
MRRYSPVRPFFMYRMRSSTATNLYWNPSFAAKAMMVAFEASTLTEHSIKTMTAKHRSISASVIREQRGLHKIIQLSRTSNSSIPQLSVG